MKEHLRKMILEAHSITQRDKIVDWVGEDKNRFKILMELFLGTEKKVVQRASWAVRVFVKDHPNWLKPYVGNLIKVLENPIHDAVLRHGFLALENTDISEIQMGKLTELAFDNLQDPKVPTAIKRAALLILVKVCDKEPDLKAEVVLVLEDQIPHSTVGFVNIAQKVIKKFRR